MKIFAFIMCLGLVVAMALLPDDPAYHHEELPARQDRIAVLTRTCFESGTVRLDLKICRAFADEIREAAEAAEKETTLARANQ